MVHNRVVDIGYPQLSGITENPKWTSSAEASMATSKKATSEKATLDGNEFSIHGQTKL